MDDTATSDRCCGLTAHDVNVRVMGDTALIHGRVTYTTKRDGADREARYTDTYQYRDGRRGPRRHRPARLARPACRGRGHRDPEIRDLNRT